MVRKATPPSTSRFQFSALHAGKGLFQQFIVDMGAKLISERLTFFRSHQDKIRAELYSTLHEQATAGGSLTDVGRSLRLPSSFLGDPETCETASKTHLPSFDEMVRQLCLSR